MQNHGARAFLKNKIFLLLHSTKSDNIL